MYTNQSSRYSTITRLTQLSFFAFVFCLLSLISNTGYARQSDWLQLENQACDIQLKSIQATKDQHQLKTTDWVDITLPDYWEKRWKGYSGTVWYRINWSIHCAASAEESLAISIDSINMAGEVYLNGQRIWKDHSQIEPLTRSWNTPHYWILPPSSFHDGENTLLIKVVGVATQSPGLGLVKIGSPHLIVQQYEQYIFNHRTVNFINLIISATLGFIGFLIWLLRPQDRTFAWFALASILWVAFVSSILLTKLYLFNTTLQYAKFNLSMLLLYSLCFTIFTWRFAAKHYPKTESCLWLLSIALILILILIPTEIVHYAQHIVFLSAAGLFLGNCIFYQWIAIKTPKIDIRILAGVLLGYIALVCHDLIKLFNHDSSGFMGTPFAALLMALALSLILGWRIAQNMIKIESFNEQLEVKIARVKLELEHSLDKKHQLEIENMRLQERLNLAHDLHDGLGGSLVRSMILVDKAEDFNKQGFMSILKLLRNDLRQIIDSGSSIGAKIPETPIIWGAPLRHRYIQIFEEIEIESKWHFPAHWASQPTALECLTLARVTEEALTNIVKHSQATHVEVSLSSIEHTLHLSIVDNGIGFDPSTVQAGLHVGLHSMQVRVNRIGGEIKIFSSPGETRIEVVLKQHNFDSPAA